MSNTRHLKSNTRRIQLADGTRADVPVEVYARAVRYAELVVIRRILIDDLADWVGGHDPSQPLIDAFDSARYPLTLALTPVDRGAIAAGLLGQLDALVDEASHDLHGR